MGKAARAKNHSLKAMLTVLEWRTEDPTATYEALGRRAFEAGLVTKPASAAAVRRFFDEREALSARASRQTPAMNARRRQAAPRAPELERRLAAWCRELQIRNLPLDPASLKAKAREIGARPGAAPPEFRYNRDWLSKFRRLHDVFYSGVRVGVARPVAPFAMPRGAPEAREHFRRLRDADDSLEVAKEARELAGALRALCEANRERLPGAEAVLRALGELDAAKPAAVAAVYL